MNTEIPKGYRKATPLERDANAEVECAACAQPKIRRGCMIANHSKISLCHITGENDCENHGFFVKDPA